MGAKLVEEIYAALECHTVVMPNSAAAESILPKLVDSLKKTLQQQKTIGADVDKILDARRRNQDSSTHPSRVGDGSAFTSAGHLLRMPASHP